MSSFQSKKFVTTIFKKFFSGHFPGKISDFIRRKILRRKNSPKISPGKNLEKFFSGEIFLQNFSPGKNLEKNSPEKKFSEFFPGENIRRKNSPKFSPEKFLEKNFSGEFFSNFFIVYRCVLYTYTSNSIFRTKIQLINTPQMSKILLFQKI